MAILLPVKKVKAFCGIISASNDALRTALDSLHRILGPADIESESFPFDFTRYYEAEMGSPLTRRFVSFDTLLDPAGLPDIKLATNGIELDLAGHLTQGQRRLVNLDPGYLTDAKMVLATTKDFAHRVYLGKGIYAEVTMRFRGGRWEPLDWTYPDFRSGLYDDFFTAARSAYLKQAVCK